MAKKPAGNQLIDPEQKKLFNEMLTHWRGLKDRADSASGKLRKYVKDVKTAGFSVQMFKDAIQMETPEGEAEFRAEVANRLLAAAYMDSDIGDQLGLFLDNNRTPAVDRAWKEGQSCAMKNEAAVPKYDPDTEQYRAFMDGYHVEQERQVRAGIKKLEPEKAAANAKGRNGKGAKPDKAKKADKPAGRGRGRPAGSGKPKDDAPPRKPGTAPVTRADLQRQAASSEMADAPAQEPEPASYFSKAAGNA